MEKKLKMMFDFQRFENNAKLSKLIAETETRFKKQLDDDELELIAAAGEAEQKKEK